MRIVFFVTRGSKFSFETSSFEMKLQKEPESKIESDMVFLLDLMWVLNSKNVEGSFPFLISLREGNV